MPSPRVVVQPVERDHGSPPLDRIEMDIADELEQVALLLDQDALEAILEHMSCASMTRLKVTA
jgi:hypothetical protein